MAVGAGVATVGTLGGVPPVVSGCAMATAGARVESATGASVAGGGIGVGVIDGSTDGVGSTAGVGVGPLVGGGMTVGPAVGWAVPGADDGGCPVDVGAVVGPPGVLAGPSGVAEAKAIPGV